jgi:arylsulfatase A-like enzyme
VTLPARRSVGSAALVLLGLALAGAASAPDRDADGIPDAEDNCLERANGPGGSAVPQRDTDLDGYGNLCDADLNGDGLPGTVFDFLALARSFGAVLGSPGYDPEADLNGDGAVSGPDLLLFQNASLGPSGLACAGARPCPPQNVLLLIADDVGIDKVAVYDAEIDPGGESPPPATPQIDSLAAAGVRFRNAWGHPVCSPTRAALLTGLHAFRTGIGSVIKDDDAFDLDPSYPSIARELEGAGYETAAIGKWHLGSGSDARHVLDLGFQRFEGSPGNVRDYCAWSKITANRAPDGTLELESATSTTYATTDAAEAAISRIGAMREPWLLWVAFHSAHAPRHDAREADPCPMKESGLSKSAQYDTMVAALDRAIGSVLAAIPPGVLSRTTVLFLGDNGTSGPAASAPFEGARAKGTIYQGGINVPFIVKARATTVPAGGGVSDALVQTTDVFATLLGQAGLPLPAAVLDSVSFAAQLADPGRPSARRFAYSETFEPNGFGPYLRRERAIRDARHKLIRFEAKGLEGYDLAADPLEASDLIPSATAAQRAELACLAEELARFHGESWSFDDLDGDGVPNDLDNCALAANASQCDGDGDLEHVAGNRCDGDFDGDGVAAFPEDWAALEAAISNATYDPAFDLNCDGWLNVLDRGLWRFGGLGPAFCGGPIPCPQGPLRCPE